MDVGVLAYRFDYYPYVRNIIGVVPGAKYRKVKDLYSRANAGARLLNRLAHRQLLSTFDLNNQYYDFNLNRVDLLHFFNGISYGRTPWVSTFETVLPRFEGVVQISRQPDPRVMEARRNIRAFEKLAGPSCKCLIAISQCAAHMQHRLLVQYPQFQKIIEEKLVVMHPPQGLWVSNFEEKQVDLNGCIRFMFVGNAFFRKGGIEMLETLKMVRERYHYEMDLTIVSALDIDGYAVQITPDTIQRTKALLEENKDWITHYPHLPNTKVLELMKHAHVGLLPTYADTYGYSVLEFQASGCPVISTNVRALPEINESDKGWIIPLPTNDVGEAIYATESERMLISNNIRTGLEEALHQIFNDRSLLSKKSEQSILGIKAHHSMSEFSTKMAEIYQSALR